MVMVFCLLRSCDVVEVFVCVVFFIIIVWYCLIIWWFNGFFFRVNGWWGVIVKICFRLFNCEKLNLLEDGGLCIVLIIIFVCFWVRVFYELLSMLLINFRCVMLWCW